MTTDTPELSTTLTSASTRSSSSEDNPTTFFDPNSENDPIQIYTERLRSWKALVKLLIAYFEELRQQEANAAKGYARVAATVRPPWRHSNAFRPPLTAEAIAATNRATVDGGAVADDNATDEAAPTAVADLVHALHVTAKLASEQRERSARAIQDQTIRELNRLRLECKRRIREVNKELLSVKQKSIKADDKSKASIIKLGKACRDLEQVQEALRLKQELKTLPTDPWLVKLEVQYHLSKLYAKEGRYQQALVSFQQSLTSFEASLIQSISAAINTYHEWYLNDLRALITEIERAHSVAARQDRDGESNYFIEQHAAHLPNANTPLRTLNNTTFPHMDDPGTMVIRMGRIERKGGILNQWRECRGILTAAGYLHIFPVSSSLGTDTQTDLTQQPTPDLSIYLPNCTVGAHSVDGAAENAFELTERSSDGGGLFRKSHHRYQIRLSTRDDMLAWWEAMSKLARSSLSQSSTAPTTVDETTTPTQTIESNTAPPATIDTTVSATTDTPETPTTPTANKRASVFARIGGSFGRNKGAAAAAAIHTETDKPTTK